MRTYFKKIIKIVIPLSIVTILLVGCNNTDLKDSDDDHVYLKDIEYDQSLWPNTFILGDTYQAIINDAVKIEYKNGTNGNQYVIDDQTLINAFVEIIRDVELEILQDQSDRNGWSVAYTITNSEGKFFSITYGYDIKDNYRFDGKTIASPYYHLVNYSTERESIQAFENEYLAEDEVVEDDVNTQTLSNNESDIYENINLEPLQVTGYFSRLYESQANCILNLTNQSTTNSEVELSVYFDDILIIKDIYEVGDQHNFYNYYYTTEGEHEIRVVAGTSMETSKIIDFDLNNMNVLDISFWGDSINLTLFHDEVRYE